MVSILSPRSSSTSKGYSSYISVVRDSSIDTFLVQNSIRRELTFSAPSGECYMKLKNSRGYNFYAINNTEKAVTGKIIPLTKREGSRLSASVKMGYMKLLSPVMNGVIFEYDGSEISMIFSEGFTTREETYGLSQHDIRESSKPSYAYFPLIKLSDLISDVGDTIDDVNATMDAFVNNDIKASSISLTEMEMEIGYINRPLLEFIQLKEIYRKKIADRRTKALEWNDKILSSVLLTDEHKAIAKRVQANVDLRVDNQDVILRATRKIAEKLSLIREITLEIEEMKNIILRLPDPDEALLEDI